MEKSDKKNNKLLNFLSSGKNVAILILSLILFCIIITYPDVDTTIPANSSPETNELNSKINDLNIKVNDLEQQIQDKNQQITNLQNANKTLEEEKSQIESEKQSLENEKSELTTKIENLEKISSNNTNTSNNSKVTQNNTQNTSSTVPHKTTSSTNSNYNSQMVWVGDTGTKYHKQSCRTLKGNGHQTTMEQALSEGRRACKVCY